ncbi:hypothetical protein C3B44_03150 [Corynebacterium yudongzhengii]|uniref:Uncharacterized protein n=1 Tax=Corynebacterium yudongzhengii TaxID=2080740 RepID=A0A2U1T7L5_9CORY|nr:hypothetical protein [Corynebacterium yudongzhengii]AWB81474.1 hypothetical protein C3B44_03150 [Corynebacterium yudongzhengii]PWC01955.1 hypothetical protein DF222_05095 [Corynebacterium yudongzhengii]
MHYTSWDRSDTDRPALVEEDGVRTLAVFHGDHADVGEEQWKVDTDKQHGISLRRPDGREYLLHGDVTSDKELKAFLDGRSFLLVAESSKDWIIDDVDGNKVGQFTAAQRGVRKAIVEYDGDVEIDDAEAVALGYFSRMILEHRLQRTGTALIAVLVLLTIIALLAFIF